jgi:hypothetical protein
MHRSLAARGLLFAALLSLAGCCGGYSVVRTTVKDGGEASSSGSVLHYSRLGEPPNACGSDVKIAEDLWIQVPSTGPGQSFTIGAPGVAARYSRDQGGNPVEAKGISGKVTIKERTAQGVVVRLDVTVGLPSGDSVRLDDEYAFHPQSAGER